MIKTKIMDKKTMIFRWNNSSTQIDVCEITCTTNNIRICDLDLPDENTLIKIEHPGLTTMLDFSNSADFQVLYLTEENWIVGGSYAINNQSGFILQTQEKFVLLMKCVYKLNLTSVEGNEGKRKIERLLSNKF